MMSIIRQVLEFQKDGYANFSFKNGKEQNPLSHVLEECIVLDMTLTPEAIKEQVIKAQEFEDEKSKENSKIAKDENFPIKLETKTVIFFHG